MKDLQGKPQNGLQLVSTNGPQVTNNMNNHINNSNNNNNNISSSNNIIHNRQAIKKCICANIGIGK